MYTLLCAKICLNLKTCYVCTYILCCYYGVLYVHWHTMTSWMHLNAYLHTAELDPAVSEQAKGLWLSPEWSHHPLQIISNWPNFVAMQMETKDSHMRESKRKFGGNMLGPPLRLSSSKKKICTTSPICTSLQIIVKPCTRYLRDIRELCCAPNLQWPHFW